MLLQSAATGAKTLRVHNKITACVKEICLLGVVCKVSKRKTLSGETVCFPEKRLLSILNFALRLHIYCFFSFFLQAADWPVDNQHSWNVLLFSCNPVGQLCLRGPSYSSRTVSYDKRE